MSYCKQCGKEIQEIQEIQDLCDECKKIQEEGENAPKIIETKESNFKENNAPGKSKVLAGILGILFGSIGIHRFYLGYITIGLLQILATVLTCGMASIWGFIEGILILAGSTITTDADGNPLSD